jgi:hypothetical protein
MNSEGRDRYANSQPSFMRAERTFDFHGRQRCAAQAKHFDCGEEWCGKDRANCFAFSAAYLRTGSIVMLGAARRAHAVMSECGRRA